MSDIEKEEIASLLRPEIDVYDMAVKLFELRLKAVPNLDFKIQTLKARQRDAELSPRVW